MDQSTINILLGAVVTLFSLGIAFLAIALVLVVGDWIKRVLSGR